MKTPPATDQLTLFYSSLLLSPLPLLQMDSENQKTEKPERFESWSLSEERVSSSTRNKSFTCSFCRREFSNAQALGGHMNIHRRDRAKLRNASPDEQISSTSSPSQVLEEKDLVILESSQDQKSSSSTVTNTARSCNFGVDDEAGTSKVKDSSPVVVKKKIQPVEGSSEPELDLELRLGPKGFF